MHTVGASTGTIHVVLENMEGGVDLLEELQSLHAIYDDAIMFASADSLVCSDSRPSPPSPDIIQHLSIMCQTV